MIQTLIGIKKDMTSGYDSRGRRVGVTKIEVAPNFVSQVKTEDKDGYSAVQIATGSKKSVLKPQRGHFKKAGLSETMRYVREVKADASEELSSGQEIKLAAIFKVGDIVKVTGTSKGKGFQGGVRRHGFHGGPKTHGQSDRHRAPGSIGSGTTPGRVYKGKNMAGHMGHVTSSVRNLEIVGIDRTSNVLMVKGGVPGHNGSELLITRLGVVKGYTPPPDPEPEEEVPSDVEQMSGVSEDGGQMTEDSNQKTEDRNEQSEDIASEAVPVVEESAPEATEEASDENTGEAKEGEENA